MSLLSRFLTAFPALRRPHASAGPAAPAPLSGEILALIDAGFGALAQGDLARAAQQGEAILARDPQQVDALYLLGQVAHSQERMEVARSCYERAIAAKPDFPDPYVKLIAVLITTGRNPEALRVWREAMARVPYQTDVVQALCLPMVDFFPGEVKQALRPVLDRPDAAATLYGLQQQVLQRLGVDGAEYDALLAAARARFAGTETLERIEAMALSYRNQVDAALAAHAALERKYPNVIAFDGELARALRDAGRNQDAMAQVARLAEIFPDNPDYPYMMSELRLRMGEIGPGLALYETRFARELGYNARHLPMPVWNGEPIDGKQLLVSEEQGIGDCIMFGRYLPMLAARCARVVYVCRSSNISLFAGQEALRNVQVLDRGAPLPSLDDFDFHVATMSVAHCLGIDTASAGQGAVYLQADPAHVVDWRARLPADGRLRVGLAWAGNLETGIGVAKSLDAAMVARLLRGAPEVAFVSLQMPRKLDEPHAELYAARLPEADFAQTLALIENMDLVISVDTSIAHLAASMGKRTIVLSKFAPDWRWEGPPGGQPYWYPAVELVRQEAPRDWEGALARLQGMLREAVASH